MSKVSVIQDAQVTNPIHRNETQNVSFSHRKTKKRTSQVCPDSQSQKEADNSFSSDKKIKDKIFKRYPVHPDHEQRLHEDMDFRTQVLLTRTLLSSFVIDPTSKYLKWWDIFVLVALFFTAIVTPYEVAMLKIEINKLFFFNRGFDLVFVIDMWMNFFMAYWEDCSELAAGGRWVKDLQQILTQYLQGWFSVDLISVLPFDVISYFLCAPDCTGVSQLKFFKIIRLLRILKLLRVLKSFRIIHHFRDTFGISSFLLSFLKFMCTFFFLTHWLTCLWAAAGILFEESGNKNWISTFIGVGADLQMYQFEIYREAFYFTVYTTATIGYGNIFPVNTGERWVCTVILLLGSTIFAGILRTTCGAVVKGQDSAHHQMMDDVIFFTNHQQVESKLKIQIRKYFQNIKAVNRLKIEFGLIMQLSPELRKNVIPRAAHWMEKFPWSKQVSVDFVSFLVHTMSIGLYISSEILPSMNFLCVINRGVVMKQRQLYFQGDTYGCEDILLSSTFLKDKSPALSLTYTELLYIERADFLAVLGNFPKDEKYIRQNALKHALKKALLLVHSFSKCNWTFTSATKIPFVADIFLSETYGKKYERVVCGLHPVLRNQCTHVSSEIQIQMAEIEDQDRENVAMIYMLGCHKKGEMLHCSHNTLQSRIQKVEAQIEPFVRYLEKIDSSLEEILNFINESIQPDNSARFLQFIPPALVSDVSSCTDLDDPTHFCNHRLVETEGT